ncbi:MAG TPA: glutamate--tRNA ligase [Candidatus Saccharimonadales bacterium]|nr:glutamate--tRNA ligase [Candidatus Saccharimonadales bacterium]
MAEDIRVRIAPSPTGKFHIGTARTALFNYLFAKKNEGKFILRIEDTDRERSEEVYTKDIVEGLKWLGLNWDEGPEVGGAYGPYFQQERLGIYEEYTEQLLEEKKAYKCFCTPEELDKERAEQQANHQPPKYSGKCRGLTQEQIEQNERAGKPYAIRFIIEPQSIVVDDLIRGKVEFDAGLFGDFPIVRSDGTPLFIYTNVIDDRLMEISHVLRGEEHLANAAKQIILAQGLNFLNPQFGHFPLIFNADHSKMSKRKDPVSVNDDYRQKGFLPEALLNYMVLLGWSSGTDREIYSLHDLISEFQIERVGKSPSIFDPEKLLWMNGYYIRNYQVGDLAEGAKGFIKDPKILAAADKEPEFFLQTLASVQDRLKKLDEVEPMIELFYEPPKDYPVSMLVAKKSTAERAKKALQVAAKALGDIKDFSYDSTEIALRASAKANDLKDGEILWTVRVALTGKEASPGTFELLEILGKPESLRRIETAQRKIKSLK